jgi:hypothetical protein
MLPILAGGKGVELVDLEGFYGPGMVKPQALSSGSAGYAHKQAVGGLWGPEADRFAGAVLLAEMLGFCDEGVCQEAWGESYFDPAEMQEETNRFRKLIEVLERRWGGSVAHLFERAWRSDSLLDCPTFGEWLVALPEQVAARAVSVSVPVKVGEGVSVPGGAEGSAEIRAFMQAGRRMEEKGNLEGALELYRQALEVAQGDPTLRSLVKEIELTIQEVETKYKAMERRINQEKDSKREVRKGPYPEFRWSLWTWALMGLIILLCGLIFAAWYLVQITSKINLISTPIPISAQKAHQTVQLARWGKGTVNWLASSPDGRLLAVASSLGIYLYDANNLTDVRFIETNAWVFNVVFSPDGTILAAGLGDGTIRLWRVADGSCLQTLEGHKDAVTSVVFSPDGATIASGSRDYTVRLWRVADGALLRVLKGHSDRVTSALSIFDFWI